jgi:hypothetical protein
MVTYNTGYLWHIQHVKKCMPWKAPLHTEILYTPKLGLTFSMISWGGPPARFVVQRDIMVWYTVFYVSENYWTKIVGGCVYSFG